MGGELCGPGFSCGRNSRFLPEALCSASGVRTVRQGLESGILCSHLL